MQRRYFIKAGVLGLGGLSLGSAAFSYFHKSSPNSFYYITASSVEASILPIPSSMRIPFEWNWFGVHNEAVILKFKKDSKQKVMPALFRITTAIDVREKKLVEVFLLVSNKKLGVLDISYAPLFQPFELALSASDVEAVFAEGLALKQIKGNSPLWLFTEEDKVNASNKGLMPHLLFYKTEKKSLDLFFANFLSLNSVQSFGWMEGCVLDSLMDLNKRYPEKKINAQIDAHLNLYFDKQNNLFYEGPYSKPYKNEFYGIEALLPFAAIAQRDPKHPLLSKVADYCLSKKDSNGLIIDRDITTEGCYTIAYPLASIAIALQQKDLAASAIQQLLIRKNLLVKDEKIHQKMDENKQLSFANWARGVSWYLLGLVRTLSLLEENPTLCLGLENEISILKQEFTRAADWAIQYQNSANLWFCFLDKPESGIDTSGSAGIAAAMAIGVAKGYLQANKYITLQSTLKSLYTYLTPDGFLSGAAQANKGGRELQESGYRVISQYASGLMAQLIAGLNEKV